MASKSSEGDNGKYGYGNTDQNAVIVAKNGGMLREMCLGDGI